MLTEILNISESNILFDRIIRSAFEGLVTKEEIWANRQSEFYVG